MFSLPLTFQCRTQRQKLSRPLCGSSTGWSSANGWCLHCAVRGMGVNVKDDEDNGAPWAKQRRGWCLLFLPPCRFACLWQKRKASSLVCKVCAFRVCALAPVLFVYMSAYAFQPSNNAVCLYRSQSVFVHRAEWVSGWYLAPVWDFLRFWLFFFLFVSLLPAFDINS